MNHAIPCFYYPTTIVFVDDDPDLLNSLQLAMSDEFKCQTFISVDEAKNYIMKNQALYSAKKNKYLPIVYEDLSDLSVSVEISEIHKEIFNNDRFKESFILIVDYDMPEVDGLKFARFLKDQCAVKIIMLTGAADTQMAVDAFNARDIDRFLLKNDVDYGEKLSRYIQELMLDHFVDRTKSIFDSINISGDHPLQDSDFVNEFEGICKKYQICEYYLLDDAGSFLLNDITGKNPILMIVRTPNDMQTFCELAEDDPEILKSLKGMEKLPYVPHGNGLNYVKDWVFQDSTKVKNKNIYYGLLFDKNKIPLNTKDIWSYEQFLTSEN